MKIKFISLAVLFGVFLAIFGFSAESSSLFPLLSGREVKVHLADVKDLTSAHAVDPALVKAKFEEAMKNRKSIHFQIVENPEEAQITIETILTEFLWTDHDPVDMLLGAGSAALDAAMVEDYARLEADITVTDVRAKKILWKDRVLATVTKKPMSRTDSLPLVTDHLAKTFIKNCFSKRRAK